MKKLFCDLCGKEIPLNNIKTDYGYMSFVNNNHAEEKHLHTECAVRVKNLLESYFHAVQQGFRVELKVHEGEKE